MTKAQYQHHADRLTKAIEKIDELDDQVFEDLKVQEGRLDFVRSWKVSPRSKKAKEMPPICLYGAALAQGKRSAKGELEKMLQNTMRNIERFK